MISCRFCRGADGELVLDLGGQPPSEQFPARHDPRPDPLFPLRMWLCKRCELAQLADDHEVPENPVGQEPAALAAQRAQAVGWLARAGLLPPGGTVAEFGSPHGGTFLDLLAGHGLTPAEPGATADVVVDGCFGLMHAADQRAALDERAGRLKPGGLALIQFHTLSAILGGGQWNALRHAHFGYYSAPALTGMLASVGLSAVDARRFPLYGGTVLLAAVRDELPERCRSAELDALLTRERAEGVTDAGVLRRLRDSAGLAVARLRELVLGYRASGLRVYGYGAASRAVAQLNMAGLDERLLLGVADVSPAKQGCRMPGTGIPIISPRRLVAARPDVVLVFVSELLAEVAAALPEIAAHGGRWVDANH